MVEGNFLVLKRFGEIVMHAVLFASSHKRFWCHILPAFLVLVCVLFLEKPLKAQEVNEEQIKAVFLYNLAHFVVWPEDVIASNPTFDIGMLGDSGFRKVFKETVQKETVGGKQFVVSKVVGPADITEKCRIIFISGKSAVSWGKLEGEVKGLPILTVSDSPEFSRNGGMVSLIRQGRKIKIEVNYETVQEAGLKMSAKLLRLARIVE